MSKKVFLLRQVLLGFMAQHKPPRFPKGHRGYNVPWFACHRTRVYRLRIAVEPYVVLPISIEIKEHIVEGCPMSNMSNRADSARHYLFSSISSMADFTCKISAVHGMALEL